MYVKLSHTLICHGMAGHLDLYLHKGIIFYAHSDNGMSQLVLHWKIYIKKRTYTIVKCYPIYPQVTTKK